MFPSFLLFHLSGFTSTYQFPQFLGHLMISLWLVFLKYWNQQSPRIKEKRAISSSPFEGSITRLPLPNSRKAKLCVHLGWEKSYLGTGETSPQTWMNSTVGYLGIKTKQNKTNQLILQKATLSNNHEASGFSSRLHFPNNFPCWPRPDQGWLVFCRSNVLFVLGSIHCSERAEAARSKDAVLCACVHWRSVPRRCHTGSQCWFGLKFLQMHSEAGCGPSIGLIVFDDWWQTDKSLILVSLVTVLYPLLWRSQLLWTQVSLPISRVGLVQPR